MGGKASLNPALPYPTDRRLKLEFRGSLVSLLVYNWKLLDGILLHVGGAGSGPGVVPTGAGRVTGGVAPLICPEGR